MVVDPAKGTRTPAFDQGRLAAALAAASNGNIKDDAQHLRLQIDSLSQDGSALNLTYAGRRVPLPALLGRRYLQAAHAGR